MLRLLHKIIDSSKHSLKHLPQLKYKTQLHKNLVPINLTHNLLSLTTDKIYYVHGVEEETLPIPNPTPIYPTTQLTDLNTHNQQNPHPLA